MSLLVNGFENAFTGWTSHYVTGAGTIGEVIPAAAFSGGFGFHALAPVSAGNAVYQDVGSQPVIYAGAMFKFIQGTTSTAEIIMMQNGATNICGVRLTSTGQLRCYNRNGATSLPYATSVKNVVDGQWHFILYALQVDAVNGIAQLWIDGNLEATVGPYNNTVNGITTRVKMGIAWNYGGTVEITMDDAAISTQYIAPPTPTYTYSVTMSYAQGGGPDLTYSPPSGYLNISQAGTYTVPIAFDGVNYNGQTTAFKGVVPAGYSFLQWQVERFLSGAWVVQTPLTGGIQDTFKASTPNTVWRITLILTAVQVRTLTFNSSPIAVNALINGTQVPAGNQVQFANGTQVTVQVPAEVII